MLNIASVDEHRCLSQIPPSENHGYNTAWSYFIEFKTSDLQCLWAFHSADVLQCFGVSNYCMRCFTGHGSHDKRNCFCRRGNWITLKMRKLIKPKSRERMRSLTQTPSHSESNEGFLTLPLPDSQDSSSVGSGSNSLEDTLTHRSSSEYQHTSCSALTVLQLTQSVAPTGSARDWTQWFWTILSLISWVNPAQLRVCVCVCVSEVHLVV